MVGHRDVEAPHTACSLGTNFKKCTGQLKVEGGGKGIVPWLTQRLAECVRSSSKGEGGPRPCKESPGKTEAARSFGIMAEVGCFKESLVRAHLLGLLGTALLRHKEGSTGVGFLCESSERR